MKKHIQFLLTITTIAISCNSFAQVPQKMSYQSVIRNSEGNLVVNTAIGIQISILKDTPTGQAVYTETMTNTTNENGLLSIEIGGGTPVLGNFSQIDWSSGTYFVKTETDPTGGTNYTIVGTVQLLSVPYALYAGSSKNLGQTTVIIDAGATDAEAAIQISEEVGPNTETVIVENTQLTSLDLSGMTRAHKIIITGNLNLTSIDLSNLKKTYDTFTLDNNPQVTSINLNSLNYIAKTFSISNCGVQTLNIPSLTKFSLQTTFTIENNQNLTSINFPNLHGDTNNLSEIKINSNINLNTVELPLLKYLFSIQIEANENLTSLNLNTLEVSSIYIYGNKLTSFSLPNLTSSESIYYDDSHTTTLTFPQLVNNDFITINNTLLNSISIPSSTCAYVTIQNNNVLVTIDIPNLTTSTYVTIQNNIVLATIDIPNLTTIKLVNIQNNNVLVTIDIPNLTSFVSILSMWEVSKQVNISNNALPSSQINWWLNKLTTINSISGIILDLSNQNPPAPPTGQGLLDKQTLIDNGYNVITD